MEGFVESFLEFVIFSGLFYQSISLGSNLCIHLIHLWAVSCNACVCDIIPPLWDSSACLSSFQAKRIHTALLSFSHFLNHCAQTSLLVVVVSACSFSLSSHGAKNPTSAYTFSVEPPSYSISKTFLCRFCGKKRSLSWLFVKNDKCLLSGGGHNFWFRCWGINSTL
jgi:hypothetical protein